MLANTSSNFLFEEILVSKSGIEEMTYKEQQEKHSTGRKKQKRQKQKDKHAETGNAYVLKLKQETQRQK